MKVGLRDSGSDLLRDGERAIDFSIRGPSESSHILRAGLFIGEGWWSILENTEGPSNSSSNAGSPRLVFLALSSIYQSYFPPIFLSVLTNFLHIELQPARCMWPFGYMRNSCVEKRLILFNVIPKPHKYTHAHTHTHIRREQRQWGGRWENEEKGQLSLCLVHDSVAFIGCWISTGGCSHKFSANSRLTLFE